MEKIIKLPEKMNAMVTMGHGGLEKIVFKNDWPRPDPALGEVLVRVLACGLNNTDINTRTGWYSKTVSDATTGEVFDEVGEEDPTWGGKPITFPRIQGADVCGEIVAVGTGINPSRIGERIITDGWIRNPNDPFNKSKVGYFGSECDGGFADYAVIPSSNALSIDSNLTDAELATFSCSYSTAEGMLSRANVLEEDTVLIPGASGGVGGALVQLAKRRKAKVIALASIEKHKDVISLGADRVLPRSPENIKAILNEEKITVVADVVGGKVWGDLIDVLERGGRYVCSGAIAGPIVGLDLRTLYLRDLTFHGSSVLDPQVTIDLVKYIETGQIKPCLAATFKLHELREAQETFIAKKHTGNIVVTT